MIELSLWGFLTLYMFATISSVAVGYFFALYKYQNEILLGKQALKDMEDGKSY